MQKSPAQRAAYLDAFPQREARFAQHKWDMLGDKRYICLQVGDHDLIGNKFNGHDLHLLLQARGVQAYHCVVNKASQDDTTLCMPPNGEDDFGWRLLQSDAFLAADILHLHLIHNTDFDISLLPLIAQLKPTVITLHDAFFLGGHCIHSFGCDKWKTHCGPCPYPKIPFLMLTDVSAVNFDEKYRIFQGSDINMIVASTWMEDKVRQSPIFAGKKIHRLPFGIDQTIFAPGDQADARRALGIAQDATVLLFRADTSPFKGLDVIKSALGTIRSARPITLLTVNKKGLLKNFEGRYTVRDFGWIKDNKMLATLYQACDLFLAPSRQGAFGMMAIEAMCCGKTVLATTGTSLSGVIHAPECGVAVAEAAYADALQRLLDDPAEREARGAASLAYARAHYGLETYMDGMLRIYDEVMQAHLAHKSAAKETRLPLPEDPPLVSVIIPPYNDAATLPAAIESVLGQTYPAIEIIVIDDGSQDDGVTTRIGAQYGARIRFVATENRGVAAARNRGIAMARGKYIAFLDADDFFHADKIEKQIRCLLQSGLSFCHTSYNHCTFEGQKIGKQDTSLNAGKAYPQIIQTCLIATPTVMIRRDALGEDRFCEGMHYGEDNCLWIDLAARMDFAHIPEALADVRINAASAANDPEKLCLGMTNILQHVLADSRHTGHAFEKYALVNAIRQVSQEILLKKERP